MTVAATVRKAGPTVGNALATVFPFAFKVFSAADLLVQLTTIASGVVSTLVLNDPLGYTVALNADQNANPGGSITYNPSGVPLPATQSLTISSVVPQVQGTHIINGGAFFANNVEDAVDKAVINVQDLAGKVGASIQFPAVDSAALNAVLPPAATRANTAVLFDGVGNVIAGAVPQAPTSAAWLPVVQAATLPLGRAAMGFSAFFDSLIASATAAAMRLLLGLTAIATKGDTWYGSAANTLVTKAAPANGLVRMADSTQADGWQDVAAAFMFKNRLINPDGRITQRGFAAGGNANFIADRWYTLVQTGNVTPSALADPEDGYPAGIRITQSQAAAQRFGLAQIIEGKNCKDLRAKSGVLVPRIRASNAQNIRYAILGWTGAEDTVTRNVVNDWTSGVYTPANFFLAASVSVLAIGVSQPGANAWTSLPAITGALGSAFNNIVILVWTEGTAAQNFTLDFDYVQFERGSVATEFERRHFAAELALCQRYYEKSYNASLAPGSVSALGLVTVQFGGTSNGTITCSAPFKVSKRATPTDTIYSGGTGTAGKVSSSSGDLNSISNATGEQAIGNAGTNAGATISYVQFHWTADAEL